MSSTVGNTIAWGLVLYVVGGAGIVWTFQGLRDVWRGYRSRR